MARIRAAWQLIALGAAIAALMACGSSGVSANDLGTDPDAAAQAEDAEEIVSALVERVGVDFGDESAMTEWFETAETEWRLLTTECMLDEGFEYSQEEWTSPGTIPTVGRWTSREYAEEYGFGVVSAFLAATYDPSATYEPPNAEYVETLSPSERDAYYLALLGNPEGENDSDNGLPQAGCAGDAASDSFALMEGFEQITPLFEDYTVRIEADPRMVAITEQWTNCMAGAGYGGIAQDRLFDTFANRLVAIFRSGDVFAYSPSEIPDLPEPDLPMNGPSWMVLPELNVKGQEKVDELQVEEIGTATAAFDCTQETLEESQEIQREYENEFVVEFEAEIDAAFSG